MAEILDIVDKNKEHLIIPDGISVISVDHSVIVFNEAASRITGYNENNIIGKNIDVLFSKSKKDLSFIFESMNNNTTFSNLAINITDSKGIVKNVLASITPIRKDKTVLSIVFVFRDTKEMLSMAEEIEVKTYELINQKNKLNAIFNSNIEGTFTIDNDWFITSFNQSAEKITGFKASEAIGKKCRDIFKSTLCGNGCHMEQTMQKEKSTIGNELEIINKQGNKVPIKVNSGILLDNRNQKIGAVETFIDLTELKNLSSHIKQKLNYDTIIGKNKEMDKIYNLIDSVAQTDSTVLITGESGTGKELFARAIHLNSSRFAAPFIPLNCSAFAESLIESELFGHEKGAFTGAYTSKTGKFELAHNGTLFLDEVADISLPVQTKLLRVLETRQFERVGGNKSIKINVRIITATNKNLSDEVKAGRFREDLFYRINVVNIHLPPLRERMDDFSLLVNHFIQQFNKRFHKSVSHFSPEAYHLMEKNPWYGNIRELENVIEHCFVLCRNDIILTEHLPERLLQNHANGYTDFDALKENMEKKMILQILENNDGSKIKTAQELNINPSTLWRKMKKYKISFKIIN